METRENRLSKLGPHKYEEIIRFLDEQNFSELEKNYDVIADPFFMIADDCEQGDVSCSPLNDQELFIMKKIIGGLERAINCTDENMLNKVNESFQYLLDSITSCYTFGVKDKGEDLKKLNLMQITLLKKVILAQVNQAEVEFKSLIRLMEVSFNTLLVLIESEEFETALEICEKDLLPLLRTILNSYPDQDIAACGLIIRLLKLIDINQALETIRIFLEFYLHSQHVLTYTEHTQLRDVSFQVDEFKKSVIKRSDIVLTLIQLSQSFSTISARLLDVTPHIQYSYTPNLEDEAETEIRAEHGLKLITQLLLRLNQQVNEIMLNQTRQIKEMLPLITKTSELNNQEGNSSIMEITKTTVVSVRYDLERSKQQAILYYVGQISKLKQDSFYCEEMRAELERLVKASDNNDPESIVRFVRPVYEAAVNQLTDMFKISDEDLKKTAWKPQRWCPSNKKLNALRTSHPELYEGGMIQILSGRLKEWNRSMHSAVDIGDDCRLNTLSNIVEILNFLKKVNKKN